VFIVPIITVILLLILLALLYRTKYGIAIRALAFDIKTVSLMGIDANKIIMYVFIIGSSLAAVGGIFWAISYPVITPYMGVLIGLKAFAAAVLGGIGSVYGAFLGGIILGFTEVMFVAFFPEHGGYKDAIAFVFLIFVLLFRPTGIMGINFEKSRF
jgi:branched-chain amino acid transport system permease protein